MKMINAIVVAAAGVSFLAAAVIAADTSATAPVDTVIVPAVKLTKAQFVAMVETMRKVVTDIEKKDPESAKAIRAAMDKAETEFISQNMEEVTSLLKSSITKAYGKERDIDKSLDEVLRVLRDPSDTGNREEYLQWLQAMKEKVDAMIQKQKDLANQSSENISPASKEMAGLMQELDSIVKQQEKMLDDTGKLQQTDPEIKKLSDVRSEIDDLIGRQEKLTDAVEKAPIGERPALGKAQEKLGETTQGIKDKLDKLAKDDKVASTLDKAGVPKEALSEASKNTGSAKDEMGKASDSLSKSDAATASDPQKQALVDLKNARKALDNAIAKAGEKTPAGEMGAKQDELAKKTKELGDKVQGAASKAGVKADSANMKSAAGQMSKASEQLSGQNASKASEHQKKALEDLKNKKTELAQLQRKLEEKKPTTPAEQKPPQDDLAKDTKDAAGEMAKMAKKQDKQETPGQQNMQNASKNTSKASDALGENKPSDANDEQKKAIEELAKVQKALDDAIAEEEQKKDEEKLAKIDQLLTAALEKQKALSKGTKDTYSRRSGEGEYARKEQQELVVLSDGELKLQGDVAKVKKMLDDEKSAVVFPVMLQDVGDKLVSVQKKLSEKEAGLLTQATQAQIEQTLENMINSIRKSLAEHRDKGKGGGGNPGGGGHGDKSPLIPPIAELKLLWTMQVQIAGTTKLLDKQVSDGVIPKEKAEPEFKTLTDLQKKVQDMAEQMKKKLAPPPAMRGGPGGLGGST